MDPRWGVLLPTFDPWRTGRLPPVAAAARHAEALGFDSGWVGDHLICSAPLYDATMALGAAAGATERLGIGYSVMLLGLRTAAQAARELATLDALSGGRVTLGVGVGGEHPEEFAAAGVAVGRRGRLLDERLDAVPGLLAQRGARVPRVLVGGRGDVALRRVARAADGWLPMWLDAAQIAAGAERVRMLSAAAGRTAPTVTLLVLVRVDEDVERARVVAAEHLDGQYRLPLRVVERWAALGSVEAVADALAAYLRAGVDEFVLMPLGPAPHDQYESLARVRELVAASVLPNRR